MHKTNSTWKKVLAISDPICSMILSLLFAVLTGVLTRCMPDPGRRRN